MNKWPWLWAIAAVVLLSTLTFLLWLYLKPISSSERKEFVQLLCQIVGGLALLIGLLFTWRNLQLTQNTTLFNLKQAQETLKVSQESQITDRFSRAVEQLGSEKVEIRLGGIYGLERIAQDSRRDYWPIMETLTAYIREHRPWPPRSEHQTPIDTSLPSSSYNENKTLPIDIQAILTAIKRRRLEYEEEKYRLDLRYTDLRGAKLSYIRLKNGQFDESNLERVDFDGTDLREASFWGANLQHASFGGANLQEAYFAHANVQQAFFGGADLRGALLQNANLQGAKFGRLVIQGKVVLEEAKLDQANFSSANLQNAEDLTQEQLDMAFGDDKTLLPPGLRIRVARQ